MKKGKFTIVLDKKDLPKHRASELYMDSRFKPKVFKNKRAYVRKKIKKEDVDE